MNEYLMWDDFVQILTYWRRLHLLSEYERWRTSGNNSEKCMIFLYDLLCCFVNACQFHRRLWHPIRFWRQCWVFSLWKNILRKSMWIIYFKNVLIFTNLNKNDIHLWRNKFNFKRNENIHVVRLYFITKLF